MEMLWKKEAGTAKVILGGFSFVKHPLASGPERLPSALEEPRKQYKWPKSLSMRFIDPRDPHPK